MAPRVTQTSQAKTEADAAEFLRQAHKAFFDAVCRGDAGEVQRLVSETKGLNIESSDSHGLRALHKASTRGFVDVLKVLIDAGAEKNALHLAGDTPLMRATAYGHAKAVAFLLKKGVNPDVANGNGLSALEHARKNGHVEVVALLEEWLAARERWKKERFSDDHQREEDGQQNDLKWTEVGAKLEMEEEGALPNDADDNESNS